MRHLAALSLLAPSLLALCLAPAVGRASGVEVEPVALQDLELGGGRADFDLVLRVERKGGLPVRLRRLKYTVQVGSLRVTEAATRYEGVRLRVGEPVEIAVPVSLDAAEATALALQALTSGRFQVRLSGKAAVSVLLLPIALRFDERLVDLDAR